MSPMNRWMSQFMSLSTPQFITMKKFNIVETWTAPFILIPSPLVWVEPPLLLKVTASWSQVDLIFHVIAWPFCRQNRSSLRTHPIMMIISVAILYHGTPETTFTIIKWQIICRVHICHIIHNKTLKVPMEIGRNSKYTKLWWRNVKNTNTYGSQWSVQVQDLISQNISQKTWTSMNHILYPYSNQTIAISYIISHTLLLGNSHTTEGL